MLTAFIHIELFTQTAYSILKTELIHSNSFTVELRK